LPKSGLETITRGYRLVKSVATVSAAPSAVATNVRPLLPPRRKKAASTSATIARAAGSAGGNTPLSLLSTATATVQIANPATTAAAGRASIPAARPVRSRSSPVVRSVRNVAP
jgi:hypothetical protein